MRMKKVMSCLMALSVSSVLLTGCGGGNAYSTYSSAYKKVTANGGMNADFDVTLEMDGTTTNSTGNFKLDTSDGNNILYYEMDVDGDTITQFSDGEYIYTDTDGHKTKYSIDSKPSASSDKEEAKQKDSSSTFNTDEFLSEFSGFLEAGKIKELGLLSPIEKAAITDISENNGVYSLSFSDSLVQKYLNIMIENETQPSDGDTLTIDELNNFSYEATVADGIVTGATYSGTMKVNVPGSLMTSGEDTSYDLDFTIAITFVDPGSAVEVTIPSTDGYEEVK
jgi:hypothetical protein